MSKVTEEKLDGIIGLLESIDRKLDGIGRIDKKLKGIRDIVHGIDFNTLSRELVR